MKRILGAIAVCVFLVSGNLIAQSIPLTPVIQRNICPFEFGCDFGKWITKSKLTIYNNEGDTARVAFVMRPNDAFIAHRANMHIERLGVVVVTKPVEGFQTSDTVYVLSYTGEGFYDIWYHGNISNVEAFWSDEPLPQFQGLLMVPPQMSWWVFVEYGNSKKGWIRLKNLSDSGVRFEEDIDMGKTNVKD
jgi:hypothetical protein